MISGKAMKVILETVERLVTDKYLGEMSCLGRQIDELQGWKERAEERAAEIAALKATISELQAAVKATEPARGTWAWACEQAYRHPGKKYVYGSMNSDQTMFMSCGQLFNGEHNPFSVTGRALSATDWREVEG